MFAESGTHDAGPSMCRDLLGPRLRVDDVVHLTFESNTRCSGMSRHRHPTTGNVRRSGGGGRILPFRRKMSALGGGDRPITDPIRQFEDEEDRRRMQQNLAAAVVIIVVIVSGFWLIDHLRTSARIAACVE